MYKSEALEKVTKGIIVITNVTHEIVFWNHEIANISGISKENAIGKPLSEICPKFREKRYQDIINNALKTGQSRFCSGVLHKSFFISSNCSTSENLRQNLRVDPILIDNEISHVLLQISDITDYVQKELKLKQMIVELKKGYKAIKKSEEAATDKAIHDPLTGIYNRRGLNNALKSAMSNVDKAKYKLAVFFVDLDGFKNVNDSYGHVVGDVLLQQVAGRLKSYIRYSGRRTNDILARIGGDEFVITLINVIKKEDILSSAERIVKMIRKPFFIDNHKILVTLSLGISLYPNDAKTVNELIKKADYAMYKIKQTCKNNVGMICD